MSMSITYEACNMAKESEEVIDEFRRQLRKMAGFKSEYDFSKEFDKKNMTLEQGPKKNQRESK